MLSMFVSVVNVVNVVGIFFASDSHGTLKQKTSHRKNPQFFFERSMGMCNFFFSV